MTKDFYNILFDKDEWTCFTDNVYGVSVKHARRYGIKEETEFFSINPMKEGTTRAGKNVTVFRNILVEIDEDENGNTIPGDEQRKMFTRLGLPYSTLVWSGSKSFHAIISVDGGFKDALEYRQAVLAVYRVLQKNSIPNDESVKDVSRLSRAAGALRVNTKQLQEVAEVRERITRDQFDAWLDAHGEKVEEPQLPKVTNYISGSNSDVPTDYAYTKAKEWSTKSNGSYSPSMTTGAHVWLLNLGINFWKVDINLNEGINLACLEWGSTYQGTHGGGNLDAILTKGYEYGKNNGIAQYKLKAPWQPKPQLELTPSVTIPDELITETKEFIEDTAVDINAAGLTQYFRVATKYYKRIPDGSHILWDKQTINDDFGRGAIYGIEEKYNDFINIPDYMKDLRSVNGMYNLFRKPKHVPTPGEWPTIEKLLRKVFQGVGEDQYEVGLDYLQLLWTKPKQKLRVLVVASKGQETGKDTFLEFVRELYSAANATVITAPDFELQYNSHYASKHIIMINEVKFNNINKAIKDKIKNYVTQEKVHINGKNDRITEIDYWGHIIMATNHINDFVEMDDEDKRYWVRQMPLLDPSDKDPNFEKKISKEIPYFLHFLLNRELFRKEKAGRFWHSDEECDTEATRNVKRNSKSNLYEEIYSMLEGEFHAMADSEDIIYVKSKEVQSRVDKYQLKAVTTCLREDFGFDDRKRRAKEHFTGRELNTQMFEISRSFFERDQVQPDINVELPY